MTSVLPERRDILSEDRTAMLVRQLRSALGDRAVLVDEAEIAPFLTDWRGLSQGRAAFVLRPATVDGVATAVRLLGAAGVPLVPQGGNTSLVVGATPDASGLSAVLSLSRLNSIRGVDPVGMTMSVDAGVVVRTVQEAARAQGCVFPLSFGADGSATIGGALATNAGGNTAIRYGSARDLVLGLEVVLADGTIWNGMRALRKDNTGYSLRNLFVGSEGTLGIITGAVLRLFPAPMAEQVALCALPDLAAVLALFDRIQRADQSVLRSFEYISGDAMHLVETQIPGAAIPFDQPHPHYVLLDLASSNPHADLAALLEHALAAALETGEVLDAVIAQSLTQSSAIWRLREEQSEAQRLCGGNVKNDVSVPVSMVPALISKASAAVSALVPGVRPAPFGHIGDGNIHLNFVQPIGADEAGFMAQADRIMETVNEVVRGLGGSFSAEHGIGSLKAEMLPSWHSAVEMGLMQRLKQALDPEAMLNPGKVIASPKA